MRVRSHVLRLAFAALLVVAPALADAPADQYQQYDRDTQEIDDQFTKLGWQRFDTTTKALMSSANVKCQTFGGRIPTIKELLTILDESPHAEYVAGKNVQKYIDQNAFGPTTAVDAPYWSTTPGQNPGTVWGLNFGNAQMEEIDTTAGQAYVRCVK